MHAAHDARASGGVLEEGTDAVDGDEAARSDRGAGADDPARAARDGGGRVRHRVLERRQPDPRALGPARRRARRARRARRRDRARCAARCSPRVSCSAAPARSSASRWRIRWSRWSAGTPRASRFARSTSTSTAPCCWVGASSRSPRRFCSRSCRGCRRHTRPPDSASPAAACGSRRARTVACACSRRRRSRARSCCSRAPACCSRRSSRRRSAKTGYANSSHVLAIDIPAAALGVPLKNGIGFFTRGDAAHQRAARRRVCQHRHRRAVARRGRVRQRDAIYRRGLHARRRRRASDRPRAHRRTSLLRHARHRGSRGTRVHRQTSATRWRSSARAWPSACFRTARR